jgi:hypothetical protein
MFLCNVGMKYDIGCNHISKVRIKMFLYNVGIKYDIGCHHISNVRIKMFLYNVGMNQHTSMLQFTSREPTYVNGTVL